MKKQCIINVMYFSFLPHFLIGKRRRKGEQERGNVESGDGMYNLLFARFVFRKKGSHPMEFFICIGFLRLDMTQNCISYTPHTYNSKFLKEKSYWLYSVFNLGCNVFCWIKTKRNDKGGVVLCVCF